MNDDCLFCKMVAGEIAPDVIYETDDVLAFRDINPQAPVHALVVPKRHIRDAAEADADDAGVIAAVIAGGNEVARREGVATSGYRLVLNVGPDAGQSVFHLHLHVLGGRALGWPPG